MDVDKGRQSRQARQGRQARQARQAQGRGGGWLLLVLLALVPLVLLFLLLSLLLFLFLLLSTPTLLLLVSSLLLPPKLRWCTSGRGNIRFVLSHRRDYKISKTMHDQVMHGHRMPPFVTCCCWLLAVADAGCCAAFVICSELDFVAEKDIYTAFGRHSWPVPHARTHQP